MPAIRGAFVLLGIIALGLLWVMLTYNNLIRARNTAQQAWSDIDTQLKRRHDLIPNLVNTVKGYAAHEKETLERVVQARQQAVNISGSTAGGAKEQAAAENMLTGALRQIFALAERYPDLKANQNFLDLQRELSGTEDRINASRQIYNQAVNTYNTAIQAFPVNIIAWMFNFEPREYFELDAPAEERAVPRVQF
jgi:LemA protein